MCGIAGVLDWSGSDGRPDLRQLAGRMAGRLHHRGPDGEGVWVDQDAGIALSQRRLAIIDLTDAGAQPMVSSCGRYVLTYNGEIYNAEELRPLVRAAGRPVTGKDFTGHSDTEVLLEAISAWGLGPALARCVGMFTIALWDRQSRTLSLARDRLGIKPLYWLRDASGLCFGSELKALRMHPRFTGELDHAALARYLRFGYVPAPASIYRGVWKLEPGTILTLAPGAEPRFASFWDVGQVIEAAQSDPFKGSDADAEEALDALLRDAVRCRLVSDVPLGAFLSGGIDSSTVVALMTACASETVRSFSIGFSEAGYDESKHAAAVAAHLGTDHTELIVTPAEAQDVIPELPEMFDEPFADSSQIPTYLVSAMTRRHVTVALSGDGGDELFAGYNRYLQADRVARIHQRFPGALRAAAALGIDALSPRTWDQLFALVPEGRRPAQPGDKMHKIASVLRGDAADYYRRLVSLWDPPPVAGSVPKEAREQDPIERMLDPVARLQYRDVRTYLPDDILTKVDRASMAVALEARVPLLDHRVFAFAWSLPGHMKIRDGVGKWLLRRVLDRYVPRTLIDRPKYGFAVPIDDWLRGPLRAWAEELLSRNALAEHGLLAEAPIRQAWREHMEGRRNRQHALWTILMFQAWHRAAVANSEAMHDMPGTPLEVNTG